MKVLILSCNTGEGHNSCAKAIKAAMDEQGIECEVADTMSLVSETVSKSISDIYVYSTKSSLFENAYKLGGFVSDNFNTLKSPVYNANKLYAKNLYDYIVAGKYDAVVCVHLYPAEAITALHRKAKLTVPTFFVMTDYTCIPFLAETELDHYIVPHQDLIEEYVNKGIPREKIIPVGIPVNEKKFLARVPAEEARAAACAEFGWKPSRFDGRWFLLMSGSMGFGNLGELVNELLIHADDDDRVICVCGRNDKVREQLATEFAGEERLKLIGFTDKVSLLMDASNVLFSKPGGITSTEAIIKNIPFVHTAPIPGLEDYNARFFHYHNMSYSTVDVPFQATVAFRLCDDEAFRERMLSAQRRNSNPHTCEDIIKLITEAVEK